MRSGRASRVIVHDDVLATGGTAKAKTELVEQLGGVVVGLLFVIELTFLNGRDKLDGYDVQSLISTSGIRSASSFRSSTTTRPPSSGPAQRCQALLRRVSSRPSDASMSMWTMYDALTARYTFACPRREHARVALSSFRLLERLPGATHPAVYRVRFDCGCGDEHQGLVAHDDLDWAPLGMHVGAFVDLMTSRTRDAAMSCWRTPPRT